MTSHLPREQSGRLAGVLREQLNEMMAAADGLGALLTGNEQAQEYLSVLNRGLYRQLRLARHLALSHALESKDEVRLRLRLTDLVPLCRDLTHRAAVLLRALNIHLTFRSSLSELLTSVDPDRVEDLLLALLSNSAAAIGQGGHIEVALEKRGGNAVLLVTDDGGGVNDETLAEFFGQEKEELDVPEHPTMRLGLPLARTIASLHGGLLLADHYAGQGVRQAVSLPVQDSTQHSILQSIPVPPETGPDKVLVELSECLPAFFYRPDELDL